jgi:methyl-accepting chemotaxis protein
MKISTGFAVALLSLTAVGVVAYRSTHSLIDANNWKAHTYVVLDDLHELLSAMQDAETGQRGFLLTGREDYLQPYTVGERSAEDALQRARKLISDNANQQRRLDALEAQVQRKLDELRKAIEVRRSQGLEPALAVILSGTGKQAMDDVRKTVAAMVEAETALLEQRDQRVAADSNSMVSTIVFGIPLAFLIVGLVAFFVTRNIAGPLGAVTEGAAQIAGGDLLVRMDTLERSDEVGVLMRAFSRMVDTLQALAASAKQIAAGDLTSKATPQSERDVLGNAFAMMVGNLREVTGQMREGAEVLASSASEIVATTAQLASGSAETAAAVAQTTTTVEEVKQTAQMTSDKARRVSEDAQRTAQVSAAGRKSVEESIEAMHRIQEQMGSIADSIVRLSEQGQAIGEIIATVNDLAEQSNLLAVNAAVEAAKAGDQGKGFAVVAQEVKSLASQSKQATAQVRSILGEIQKATSAAVMATEQGSKAVDSGVKLSAQVRESLAALSDSIDESARAATQIAASAQQQMVGMDQVALAMQNIKQASAQNVAGTRQSESAAQSLQDLGLKLKALVGKYRL